MTFRDTIKAAQAAFKDTPGETLRLLKQALNAAADPMQVLYAEQELLVHNEWNERRKAGLAMYHSTAVDDVGFRFTDMGPYLAACENVGGDYAGYAAFTTGLYAKAAKLWADSRTICRHFALEADATDPCQWVPVERLNELIQPPQVWLGCDAKYFTAFASVLVQSLKGTRVHVHIMDPTQESIDMARALGCGISIEYCNSDRDYYHAARLKRFSDDLNLWRAPMWFLDVDAIANRSPVDLPLIGMRMRVRPGRIEPWNQYNACMIGADASCIPYFEAVAGYLGRRRTMWFWGIDQMALFCVYQAMTEKPALRTLNEKECDYDYQAMGVVWCNSGAAKFGVDPTRKTYNDRFGELQRGLPRLAVGKLDNFGVLDPDRIDNVFSRLAGPVHPKSIEEALTFVKEAAASAKITDLGEPPPFRQRKIGKFVYLPVEIAGRELAAKAQLAGKLAKRGFKVIVGASWNMAHHKFSDLPPGIVLFKTMNANDCKMFWQAGMAGHMTAVLNEELISLAPDEALYRANCHKWSMHLIDVIFAHGEKNAALYRKLANPSKVVITGHPRSADAHGGNPGGDIVLCSNAATINSIIDTKKYISRMFEVMGHAVTPEIRAIQEDVVRSEWQSRDILLAAARKLKDIYGARFKFRPHPAERRQVYEQEFGDCLDQSDSFSERLKDAACVVFASGCGTGLEAFNAAVPCVRLGTGGLGLSRDVGIPVHNAEAVVQAVHDILAGDTARRGNLDGHFAADSLALAIESLWRKNQYPMEFDLLTALNKRANDFAPAEFHTTKFQGASAETVAELSGYPVREVGWGMWELRA